MECSKRFLEMFGKISGNVLEILRECSKRFQRVFQKILENVQKDSLESKVMFSLENLSHFYQILQLNCYKTMEKNN